jgi:hypothetical protein
MNIVLKQKLFNLGKFLISSTKSLNEIGKQSIKKVEAQLKRHFKVA